jgi:hypothetical protein
MRQLQNLQQQMSQQQMKQQQHEMEEKLRKLQEMKQQEEEFDKHLAQTLPVSALTVMETVHNISQVSEKYNVLGEPSEYGHMHLRWSCCDKTALLF